MVQKQRIYIVDDEISIERILAAFFGGKYISCSRTLLEAASTQPPDALVSDYAMPEFSGIELVRRIVAFCPTCQIFLLSATALSLIEIWVAQGPTPDFIFFSKPLQVAQLLDAVAPTLGTV